MSKAQLLGDKKPKVELNTTHPSSPSLDGWSVKPYRSHHS